MWGCSSAGRAPALQAGGQEFDPPHLHHRNFFISLTIPHCHSIVLDVIDVSAKIGLLSTEDCQLNNAEKRVKLSKMKQN